METDELRKLLARATTPEERLAAVRRAVRAGLPLRRIEALLDWLDNVLSDEVSSVQQESHEPRRGESATPGGEPLEPDSGPQR